MKETPVVPIVETPVLEHPLFLAKVRNYEFLSKKRAVPVVRQETTNGEYILYTGVVVLSFMLALTLYPTIGDIAMATVPLVFLVSLFAIGQYQCFRFATTSGCLIDGKVIKADRIRIVNNSRSREYYTIKYRFVNPDKIVIDTTANISCHKSNALVAPRLGTPVKVWYINDEKYYLL